MANCVSVLSCSEKAMATHSSTLAWKIPGTEEPGGLQSMGRWESGMTEWLHFHFLLSCIGEGNGNPLQCSCVDNPRDTGAWWAAVFGVAQSWTRLKRLSSSSSSSLVVQWCLTLCDPLDSSLPGSSVHGIFQERILEWVAISYCRGSSPPRVWTHLSCLGRQSLYHWAAWEALIVNYTVTIR